MKVVYIGTRDPLAEALIERMNKEGNEVYFLSDAEFPRKAVDIFKHRYYKSSLREIGLRVCCVLSRRTAWFMREKVI